MGATRMRESHFRKAMGTAQRNAIQSGENQKFQEILTAIKNRTNQFNHFKNPIPKLLALVITKTINLTGIRQWSFMLVKRLDLRLA